jgi:hypothetical protein
MCVFLNMYSITYKCAEAFSLYMCGALHGPDAMRQCDAAPHALHKQKVGGAVYVPYCTSKCPHTMRAAELSYTL